MNVLQEMLKNPQKVMKQYEEFKKNFAQKNMDPQTAVQELLNSGKMKQEQFEEYRGIASQFGLKL